MDNDQLILNELRENIAFYYKDLIAYICLIAKNRYFWSGKDEVGGRSPEDIAHEVILRTLNGRRSSYEPSRGTLRDWLRYQAWSIVDALFKSAMHRHERSLPEEELFAGGLSNPENVLIEQEYREWIAREVGELLSVSDPALREVVEAVLDGCEPKPRFLADSLGTDVSDINKRLKRLRRLAKKREGANE